MSTGRNDPCPCGTGKKYKHCCLGRDQAAEQVQHRFGLAPVSAADQQASGVWQVDLTPLAIRIEADAAARPAATLVVENGVVLDVDLESAPPSDAGAIAAALERVIARTETWRGWGLPRDTVVELFRAAAEFWRQRPWRWLPSDDPVYALEGTSRPWTCTVLCNGGEEFGLALYAEAEDFFRMFEDETPFSHLTGPVLSLTFDRAAELPQRMRREVAAAGWEVAGPDAYPVLIAMNTPGGGLPHAAAEDLIRLLRTIPEFVEHHREALESPEAALELALHPPPGGIDALVDRESAVVDRFEEALRADGLSEATVRKHATNAATFVQMLGFHQGVPLRAVTEYDLRCFLFDLYPRKVMDTAHRAEAIPASLTRFFDFLAEREGIVCPWASVVLGERDAYRERIGTFPGGFWWDEGVADWRAVLDANLISRAMVHWPKHADGTP